MAVSGSVDEYIANAPREARSRLRGVRAAIRSAAPNAEEAISWGVPFYRYHGALAGFAAYKNHVSFGLAEALPVEDRKLLEAKGFVTGKKTVQIRFDQKVPAAALKELLQAQARTNEARRNVTARRGAGG